MNLKNQKILVSRANNGGIFREMGKRGPVAVPVIAHLGRLKEK